MLRQGGGGSALHADSEQQAIEAAVNSLGLPSGCGSHWSRPNCKAPLVISSSTHLRCLKHLSEVSYALPPYPHISIILCVVDVVICAGFFGKHKEKDVTHM